MPENLCGVDLPASDQIALSAGAAEIVVPNREDWLRTVNRLAQRVARLGQRSLEDRAQALDYLARRLAANSPAANLSRQGERLRDLLTRLRSGTRLQLTRVEHRLQMAMRTLHSVSPLATLDRGYAIVMDADSGKVLSDASKVTTGSDIRARLHVGELIATVKEISNDDP